MTEGESDQLEDPDGPTYDALLRRSGHCAATPSLFDFEAVAQMLEPGRDVGRDFATRSGRDGQALQIGSGQGGLRNRYLSVIANQKAQATALVARK